MFVEILRNMDFVPTVSDTDVYRRQARNPSREDYH